MCHVFTAIIHTQEVKSPEYMHVYLTVSIELPISSYVAIGDNE